MKKLLYSLLILFVIVASSVSGQSIEKTLKSVSDIDELKNAQWSGYAKYVGGDVILSEKSHYSLAPASGLKVFTSSAGLELLGSDFTFKTRFYYDGKITNGTLKGNLYIRGGGDPTFGSNLVKTSDDLETVTKKVLSAIKDAGIEKIEGKIIADDNLFYNQKVPDNWFWVDMGNYYGAQSNALTIHDNLYHLYFAPADKVGETAKVLRTEPEIYGLNFVNHMKTGKKGSGDNGYIYSAPMQYNAVLRGSIPAGVKEFSIKGSIPDPALFAAQYFTNKCIANGIFVSEKATKADASPDYTKLENFYTHVSPPLKDIVFIINKRSFNLYTEMVLLAIGGNKGGEYKSSKGITEVKRFLEKGGVDVSGFELYDGCGLSRSNMITTKMMSGLLEHMTTTKSFNDFYNSLAVAGDPNDVGFYKHFGAGTEIAENARIKSGLIEKVRSHSGYVRDQNGKLIVFSFIANNYSGSRKNIDAMHKQLMIELAKLK